MKAITIRGIEQEVSDKLKSTATKKGISVNQLTVEIIKESLGLKKEKRFTHEYNDLDELFGRWSDAEYKKITDRIYKERKIDQELWK